MSTNCVCHSLELYTATHSYHCPHILAILHVWYRHLHIYQDPIHTNYCHSYILDTCSCILGFSAAKVVVDLFLDLEYDTCDLHWVGLKLPFLQL